MEQITTRPLTSVDLVIVREIILNWDSEEAVEKDIQTMRSSLAGKNSRKYYIADIDKKVVGVIGMMEVRTELQTLTTSVNPIELTSLFVDPKIRKHGIGTILVNRFEKEAKNMDRSEIILESSEPRKKVAWGFYDQLSGCKRLGKIEHSGKKYQVWSKVLN